MTGFSHAAMHRTVVIYAYIAGYIALDWVSLIQPPGQSVALGITPWNPPAGLSFALLLRYGWASCRRSWPRLRWRASCFMACRPRR